MNLTIKRQLFLFAIFMLMIQVILCFISFNSLHSLNNNLNMVFKNRLPSIEKLVQADRDFQQLLVAERTLLIDGLDQKTKAGLSKDYFENGQQVFKRFNAYKELANSDRERKLIKEFELNFEQWKTNSKTYLDIDSNGNFNAKYDKKDLIDNSIYKVSKLFENSREKLDLLQEEILGLGEKEYNKAISDYTSAIKLLICFSIVGIFLSLFLSWKLNQNVSGKVERIVIDLNQRNHELSNISNELASRSTSLAQSSQHQASSVAETTAALHEISRMIGNNTTCTEKSLDLVKESDHFINEGRANLKELKDSINGVENSSNELLNRINKNNHDLTEVINTFSLIKEKAGVINDIVFQTKLLSFNASVEAARAGTHGKGFSVVAEEIGNLAKMSGTSAIDITTMLNDSQDRVSKILETSAKELESAIMSNKDKITETVSHTQRCTSTIENISSTFTSVAETSKEVNTASMEQKAGASEISMSMEEINKSNEITSQSATNIEKISKELLKMIKHNTSNVSSLKALVGLNENKGNTDAKLNFSDKLNISDNNDHDEISREDFAKSA